MDWRLIIYTPAYNVADSVPELLARTRKCAAALARIGVALESLIVIEDGSSDGTAALLDAEARRTPFLRVVHRQKNQGPASAVLDGMRRALAAAGAGPERVILVRMDADLEHQPEDIQKVIAPVISGRSRICVGYIRYDNRNGLLFRIFNEWAGGSEGRRSAGVAMPQFCPGFHAVRADLFRELFPQLEAQLDGFRKQTGKEMVTLDVALLALARKSGEKSAVVELRPIEARWIKKQPLSKLLRYLDMHRLTMRFLGDR